MAHDMKKSVWDAAEACRAIGEFSAGMTFESYLSDEKSRRAIEREFEILGEALKRVNDIAPSFRDGFPEMGEAIGMRHRIVHGYDVVEDATVWKAAMDDVPPLKAKLEAWLEANG